MWHLGVRPDHYYSQFLEKLPKTSNYTTIFNFFYSNSQNSRLNERDKLNTFLIWCWYHLIPWADAEAIILTNTFGDIIFHFQWYEKETNEIKLLHLSPFPLLVYKNHLCLHLSQFQMQFYSLKFQMQFNSLKFQMQFYSLKFQMVA